MSVVLERAYRETGVFISDIIRELKKTTTATATKTSPNKRINEQNNSSARAFEVLVHFLAVLCKIFSKYEVTNVNVFNKLNKGQMNQIFDILLLRF